MRPERFTPVHLRFFSCAHACSPSPFLSLLYPLFSNTLLCQRYPSAQLKLLSSSYFTTIAIPSIFASCLSAIGSQQPWRCPANANPYHHMSSAPSQSALCHQDHPIFNLPYKHSPHHPAPVLPQPPSSVVQVPPPTPCSKVAWKFPFRNFEP